MKRLKPYGPRGEAMLALAALLIGFGKLDHDTTNRGH